MPDPHQESRDAAWENMTPSECIFIIGISGCTELMPVMFTNNATSCSIGLIYEYLDRRNYNSTLAMVLLQPLVYELSV